MIYLTFCDKPLLTPNLRARFHKTYLALFIADSIGPETSFRQRGEEWDISKSLLKRILTKGLSLHTYTFQLTQEREAYVPRTAKSSFNGLWNNTWMLLF